MKNSDKAALLQVARDVITAKFEKRDPEIEPIAHLTKPLGVFVTLTQDGHLRGCIGFPLPSMPLNEALLQAAHDAAFRDPRFVPVSSWEVDQLDLEVNILTKPHLIRAGKAEDYYKKIEIGIDGLFIKGDHLSGILLPSVALDFNWSINEYLEAICEKAGMDPDAWKDRANKIYKFQSLEFSETDLGIR